jgi:Icc-related predicted phosphoesterase
MKLHILGDLHIEFDPFEFVDTGADVVILAGDIHLGERGFKWATETLSKQEVIYVLGNHEFYREATPKLIDKLREKSKGTNVHVLENDSISIEGVRFLGCTLWTDFELLNDLNVSMAAAQRQMNDYARIRISPQYRKILPSYTVLWHKRSKDWLRREIESSTEESLVIVTHHAPSINSIPGEFKNDQLAAAFASNMDDFVSWTDAKLWVHGHIHTASDYYICNTRVICNPLGYPDEPKRGFDPSLTVDLD